MSYDMQNFLDIQFYCKKENEKSKQSNIARLDTVASDVWRLPATATLVV